VEVLIFSPPPQNPFARRVSHPLLSHPSVSPSNRSCLRHYAQDPAGPQCEDDKIRFQARDYALGCTLVIYCQSQQVKMSAVATDLGSTNPKLSHPGPRPWAKRFQNIGPEERTLLKFMLGRPLITRAATNDADRKLQPHPRSLFNLLIPTIPLRAPRGVLPSLPSQDKRFVPTPPSHPTLLLPF